MKTQEKIWVVVPQQFYPGHNKGMIEVEDPIECPSWWQKIVTYLKNFFQK